VLGEWIARHYPNSAGARQAAKIALAAYLAGYNDKTQELAARNDDRDRLVGVGDYICLRWQGEQEATDAQAIVLAVLVNDKLLAKAGEYLEKIPADSQHRAQSEMKLGQAYWSQYLTAQALDDKDKPPAAELDAMIASAQKLLEAGLAGVKKIVEGGKPVDLEMAIAALSAAQIYLNAGQPDKAVALLEDAKIGPLALVTDNNPAVAKPDFAIEVYKAALRAFVGLQNLDRAEEMMKKLEEAVAATPGGRANLTKIYIALGRALEEQMKLLDDKPEEKRKVAQGFEKFLEKIAEGDEGNTFSSLNWVSETFFALGLGYDTAGKAAPAEAKAYYQKALDTDKRIVARSAAEQGFSPGEDAVLAVEMRQARALRRMGSYEEALKLLAGVVKKKPFLLDAHKEAAQVYMDQGREVDPTHYTQAIMGGNEPGVESAAPLFWGWVGLANKLGNDPRFQVDSFEARYQIANCRTMQAEGTKNPQDKKKYLAEAEYIIKIVYQTRFVEGSSDFPGKDQQRARFDALLKTIQKLTGQDAVGLKAFDQPAAGAQ
jgi:tetratricopeptide (TPR) repeat protein